MSTSDATTSSSTNNSFKTPRTRIETLNALQYIPFCPEEKKPKVGQVFETLESRKRVILQRILYNLEHDQKESRKRNRTDTDTDTAENDAESDVTDVSRVRPITRIDCRALVQFKYQENGTYIVTRFDEAHNHPLASPESTIFLKGNRKMTVVQKQFVTKVKVLKLGGVKAYRGWKELCGGYDNIGATEVDFKNFVRDIKTYIGVDHHKRCITFGAGLIGDESIECYTWLFKTFLEAMAGANLYDLKEQWIPAYFKDVSMSGLMRVTSRSESENSFFDSALEAQRHKQSKLNSENKHSEIPRKTKSNLEVHASEMYSHNIFKDFQTELVAALSDCRFKDVEKIDETKIYILTDLQMPNKSWNVAYSPDNMEITCSVLCFGEWACCASNRLWILHNQDFQKIPEQYIMQRWTKAAMSKPVFDKDGKLIDVSQKFSDRKSLRIELWQEKFSSKEQRQDERNRKVRGLQNT
ncbi:protein FAR1-RELATED SEQUENCE 5-like [Silene latifolia]|uniref:protein FAR1-RELATED SEQUENCE 5-like n=1 Tax=Silene latifolia TaxID=37657 RepID=UPI003D7736B6